MAADEIERLRVALKECADDLEAHVEGDYNSIGRHPGMNRRYERDITPVRTARALLNEQTAPRDDGSFDDPRNPNVPRRLRGWIEKGE